MKKLFIGIIGAVLMLLAYAFGAMNAKKVISIPEAEWTGGSDAAEAWREFAVSLEAAGERTLAASSSEREKLEGLLYLAQLTSASLEMKLAKGSPSEPRFTDWMKDYRKFLGDTPDAVYHTAEISSDFSYEIRGNRQDADYLGFVIYGRQINGWNRLASSLSGDAIRFDEAGNFRILLSKNKPKDANIDWLELKKGSHMVMVRQYFQDREGKTKADFSIRNLETTETQIVTDLAVAQGLREAAGFFNDTVDGAIALSDMFSGRPNDPNPPKSYNSDFEGVFYPTDDNVYYGAWFRLADDEALIVEGPVPNAPYWGLSLQNRWMQSLESEKYRSALNGRQITTQDGRYRVIVSHRKPASANWLDTTGHPQGFLSIRFQQSKDSEEPTLKRVKFDEL